MSRWRATGNRCLNWQWSGKVEWRRLVFLKTSIQNEAIKFDHDSKFHAGNLARLHEYYTFFDPLRRGPNRGTDQTF
jgi:hypothetical protein